MPPKKPLPEAPVIFTLRLPTEESVPVPADGLTNYSDILQAVEVSHAAERFSTDAASDLYTRHGVLLVLPFVSSYPMRPPGFL
jgi:hypothetical protein